MEAMGLSLEIDPRHALEQELWQAWGSVQYLRAIVEGLSQEHMTDEQGGSEHGLSTTVPSIWITMWQTERKLAVDVAKACIAAGVEERRVRVIEQQATHTAMVLRAFAERMGLDLAKPDVRAAVESSLSVVREA